MTIDLDAVKARLAASSFSAIDGPSDEVYILLDADIPALITEVERLHAELESALTRERELAKVVARLATTENC